MTAWDPYGRGSGVPLPAAAPPPPPAKRRDRLPWVLGALLVVGLVVSGLVLLGLAASSGSTGAVPAAPLPVSTTPGPAPAASPPVPSTTPGPAPRPSASALDLLAGLSSAARAVPPYDRDAFGAPWTDTDRNGCDTRNDVLRRDVAQPVLKPGTRDCVVLSGTLTDPYTGEVVAFERADGAAVQIDHVVALADAWRSGAHAWPYARRLAFANDPLELLATDGAVNQGKSDLSADQWLPPLPQAQCAFAARQVAVKARYGLAVTGPERDALQRVLSGCGDGPAPVGVLPTLAPNRSPAP